METKKMLDHYDKTSSSNTPIKGEMGKMKTLKEDLDEGVWKEKSASKKSKKASLDEQQMRDLAEDNKKSLFYKFNMHNIMGDIELAHKTSKYE
jgi:hypothetical protein